MQAAAQRAVTEDRSRAEDPAEAYEAWRARKDTNRLISAYESKGIRPPPGLVYVKRFLDRLDFDR